LGWVMGWGVPARPGRPFHVYEIGNLLMPAITECTLDERELLTTLKALKRGDFSVRLPENWTGTAGKIADTLNEIIERNQNMARELQRVSQTVGQEGKIHQRASLGNVSGSWAGMVESVNSLVSDLVWP